MGAQGLRNLAASIAHLNSTLWNMEQQEEERGFLATFLADLSEFFPKFALLYILVLLLIKALVYLRKAICVSAAPLPSEDIELQTLS